MSVRSRSGKLGVFGSVILMASIVMFAGCMFWLFTEVGRISGSPGGTLFTPNTSSKVPRTMENTVAELQRSGIIVNKYTKTVTPSNLNATYETFISEASSTHMVYTAEDLKGTPILIVETPNMVIQWYPEE